MGRARILAVGRDTHWLRAVAAIADARVSVCTLHCADGIAASLALLPEPTPDTLALIDATGEYDLTNVVRQLHALGWRRVAVVAAAPNWREAYTVLHEAPSYDYWEKSYLPDVVRHHVKGFLAPAEPAAQGLAS